MSRVKAIDGVIGHIRANFSNELDSVVRDHESIFRSAFWPGRWAEGQHCPVTFDYAQVTTDIVRLDKNATVQDVLDCLDQCAEEWRVEHFISTDRGVGDWYVTSRAGTHHAGSSTGSGKNYYDEAVKLANRLNGG